MKKLKITNIVLLLSFFLLLQSGCASFQAGTALLAGRQDLIIGNADSALAHFQRVVQLDPDYIMNFGVFQEGAWTYVGRAYYATGKLPEARQALERALSRHQNDYLARLYLGLVLVREDDRQRGAKEIESGMRGLYDWLESISYYARFSYGLYWDPKREIRSEIQSDLAMISSKDIEWQKLIASGEWVGQKMENEIDLARRDESIQRSRRSE
ncbi:MAG: tetratricopeptide repeat protein [Deltaproteobacteria bacterium]|nr:tetratricopeptide repeat protein [Deltaproteobacteria bacterium]